MTLRGRLRESNTLWHRQMLHTVPICIVAQAVIVTGVDSGPLAGRVPIAPTDLMADSEEVLVRLGQGRLHIILSLIVLGTLGAHSTACDLHDRVRLQTLLGRRLLPFSSVVACSVAVDHVSILCHIAHVL